MMQSEPLYQALLGFWGKFKEFPEGAHLFCPKTDDEDDAKYDLPEESDEDGISSEEKKERIEAKTNRNITTYRLSLLLGINAEDASTWLDEWKSSVNGFLTKCDACARTWHFTRGNFLKALEADFPSEDVDFMEQRLDEFDKERIDAGLKKARAIIDELGPTTMSKMISRDTSAVLALFEALCCMSYLSRPENRTDFNYVFENIQSKKVLRMNGGILPTMTHFLFDENPIRFKFAETAWTSKTPETLSQEEWDWAVADQLTAAITSASFSKGTPTPDKIRRFWRGVRLILPTLSEKRILESLRGMEVSPSIYFLALEHLGTNEPEALGEALKGLQTLMECPKAFWAAFDQVTPSQIVEEIFKSHAFRPFLDQSLRSDRLATESGEQVPALAVFIRALIHSLPANRRLDACESLLRHLFDTFRVDPNASQEARTTCTLAGLVALGESLEGYLRTAVPFDTGTSLLIVNQLLNRVVQYRDVIISAAQLKPGDRYNVGLSKAATGIVHSALALDGRATSIEWGALTEGKVVHTPVNRDSGALWDSFLGMLWSGRVELAKAMLMAIMPLQNIEQFLPKRKEKLSGELNAFNKRYQQQTTAIARMLGRLSDFNPSDLDMFCSDPKSETILPIVASLFHGEEAIREGAFELVKAITGELSPSEAISKMVEEYFTPFLAAFSSAVNNLLGEKDNRSPWSHMLPLLKCSEFILDGLCDPGFGRLRTKALSRGEREVVRAWWESQWRVIGHSFKKMRHWHERVDKKIMEDFCRDVMELANKLFDQDGVMASALSQGPDGVAEAMKLVLNPPNRYGSYHLSQMLCLRDIYLVQGIADVIKKLIARLKDNGMELQQQTVGFLHSMIKKRYQQATGRAEYPTKTNLTDSQRIELLKALGEDAEIEEQFIKPAEEAREKERALRQSKLDFGKASTESLRASMKAHHDDLTPNSDKRPLQALKESIRPVKPLVKPEPKPLLNAAAIKEARAKEKAEKAKRDAEAIAKAKALRAPPKIVAGEGSGLQGIIGVRGKDHAPAAKDEIMVGSSSEDDDSDDDDVLAGRAGTGKKMTDAERQRRRLLAEPQGPVKKIKIQRSAKDMRARLIPPMDILHQAILEWDIFHEGNDPPNGYRCDRVSDTYSNPHSYKQTFFPLLVNEAWRSFVTAKDEATSKPFGIKVLNRMTVDKFMEVTGSVPAATSKDRGLSEGDIVLISKGEDPLNQPGEVHCLARIWKTTYKKDTVEVIYRLSVKGNSILSVLLPGSEFYVVKITNMTTIEREYAALESLQYYDLMDEVLKAQPSPMLNYGEEKVLSVMANYQLNPGQAKAILNAKDNDGFTLVQGPPGTGKTKTIVAMVGSLLTGQIKNNDGAVAIARPGAPGAPQALSKKLLVCAPSNAAVDELVLRLKAGVKTMNGSFHKINVIRLGRTDAINAAVKDVTLDELVKAKMDAVINNGAPSDREKLHKEAGEIKIKVAELRPQLEAARSSENYAELTKLQREFDELKRRQAHIGGRIDADKSSGNTFARETEIKRRQIQQEILDKAQVLCATLSGSGHEMFKNLNVEFETVIIDEAAQCVELSALIPLKYGCSKCILVGDPKQLPPTVLSQSAARYGYDQSLFVRMQKNHAKHVHLLDMQYRMHPEISMFPSKEFYEGLLQDGDDMGKLRLQPWHQSVLLGPYRFFDVKGSQERGPRNQSLVNEEELKVAMQLYRRVRTDYANIDMKGKIGIITPYKAQLFRLRQRFSDAFGDAITEEIEFNTTDAFQGRECEIIIFSCVRASPTGGIGFMTDIRRMNVGLTRAKSSLWVLGDSRALVQGEFWAKLIDDAKRRDRYTNGNIMSMLSQPGQKLSQTAYASLATSYSNGARPHQRHITDQDTDVVMNDAPPTRSLPSTTSLPATPAGSAKRPDMAPTGLSGRAAPAEHSEGPRSDGPPVIQTSAGKKRHNDSSEGQPNAKKIQQYSSRPIVAPPRAPRSDRPQQQPIDPSAMEVLGLVPPARPTPTTQNRPAGPSGSTNLPNRPATGLGGPPRGPMPPKKKPGSDPFIRRKPGKR